MSAEFLENDSFDIPKNYKKKQKFNTLKLVIYIVIVITICAASYIGYKEATERYLPTVTFDKSRQPLVYQKLSDITLKNTKNVDFKLETINDPTDDELKIADKGTVFLYLAEDDDKGVQNLYVRKLSDDENILSDARVLDTDVSDFKATSTGKTVAYRKEGNLYIADTKKTHPIADDVSKYYLNKKGDKITFMKDTDGSIYVCGTKKGDEATLIDTNIEKLISPKTTYTVIYYLKDSVLYKKEENKEPKPLAQNVIDAIMVDDFVYFTTEEMYEKSFTDIFDDDMSIADAKLKMPKTEDFIKKTSGVSLFDAESYKEALTQYEQKQHRDKIRKYYEENSVSVPVYSLYLCNRDTRKRVDTYLESPYLAYSDNTNKDIILYKSYDTDIYKSNISSIETLDQVTESVELSLSIKMDTDIKLLKKGRTPYIAFEEFPEKIIISQDSKYLYCTENVNGAIGDLIRYEIANKALKGRTVIKSNISDFYVDKKDSSIVTVFSGDGIGLYTEGKYNHLSDSSHTEFQLVDGAFFYFDQYDDSFKSGTLMVYRNGTSTVVDAGVHEFDVRNYNTVAYIKNYSTELEMGTLYVKSGRVKRKEDICVRTILN